MKIHKIRRYDRSNAVTQNLYGESASNRYWTAAAGKVKLLDNIDAAFSSNSTTVLPSSQNTPINQLKRFSFDWGFVSDDNRLVPWYYRKSFRSPSVKGTRFEQRKRLGDIVVTPYFVGETEITYKPGILQLTTSTTGGFSGGGNVISQGFANLRPRDLNSDGSVRYTGDHAHRYVERLHQVDYHIAIDGPFNEDSYSELFFEPIDSSVVTPALAAANDGIYDILTEVMELPETLSYLAGIVQKFTEATKDYDKKRTKLLQEFRLKKIKSLERLSKLLASLWLQYRYAIMPLYYSAQDVNKLLKDLKRTFAKYNTRKADVPFEVPSFPGCTFSGTASSELRCFIKRRFDPNDVIDALRSALKVNPFATAWELVPFSFVVDWFLNVGEVISAFTGSIEFSQQAATFSSKVSISGVYTHTLTGATASVKVLHYNRVTIDPSAHIGLTLGFDMNWKRWLDALALTLNPSLRVLRSYK